MKFETRIVFVFISRFFTVLPNRLGNAVPLSFGRIDDDDLILLALFLAAISHHARREGPIHAEETLYKEYEG
jgi:hypothetical protein